MRLRKTKDSLSLQAVAGSYVVLLGINYPKSECNGLMGFGIHRTDHETDEAIWLHGLKTFKETDANGYATMIYLGPTASQMGRAEDWVSFTIQPETWWEEFGEYGVPPANYYLHVDFRIRLTKGN